MTSAPGPRHEVRRGGRSGREHHDELSDIRCQTRPQSPPYQPREVQVAASHLQDPDAPPQSRKASATGPFTKTPSPRASLGILGRLRPGQLMPQIGGRTGAAAERRRQSFSHCTPEGHSCKTRIMCPGQPSSPTGRATGPGGLAARGIRTRAAAGSWRATCAGARSPRPIMTIRDGLIGERGPGQLHPPIFHFSESLGSWHSCHQKLDDRQTMTT